MTDKLKFDILSQRAIYSFWLSVHRSYMKEVALPLRTLRVIALAKISVYQSKWPWPLNYWPESLYTERKKKRIFWLSKHWIYYKNKFYLDTSNLYPLIPTIKFLNSFFFNFCWWRIPLAMTSLPRLRVHRIYVKETRAQKQITIEENRSLNNFPP